MSKKILSCALSLGFLSGCGADKEASESKGLWNWLTGKGAPAASLCATAPELGDAAIGRSWKTRIVREDFLDSTYGIEVSDEVRLSRDPLNGSGVESRKTCSRVYSLKDGKRIPVEAESVSGSARILELRPDFNYALLQTYTPPSSSELVRLDLAIGSRTSLIKESQESCSPSTLIQPSRSGEWMAVLTIERDCMDDSAPQTAKVRYLNHQGVAVGTAESYGFASYPSLTWTSESQAVLTDAMTSVDLIVP